MNRDYDREPMTNVQRHAQSVLEYERRERRCEVCGGVAVTFASISINNQPKRREWVCRIHFDAAQEDTP